MIQAKKKHEQSRSTADSEGNGGGLERLKRLLRKGACQGQIEGVLSIVDSSDQVETHESSNQKFTFAKFSTKASTDHATTKIKNEKE